MATVAELVTNEIIKRLEAGTIPWFKPWSGVDRAVSYVSRKPYSGINRLLLEPGEYLTYNQVQERGGYVKRGAKSYIVVFYKPITVIEGEDEEPEVKRVLRYYRVFNVNDTSLEPHTLEEVEHDNTAVESAEEVIDNYINREHIRVINDRLSGRALYSPDDDLIVVPTLNQHKSAEHYYSTIFHEMGHSTAHKSRLDRLSNKSYYRKSESYSREELIAELTSSMLCAYTHVDIAEVIDNSAAYINSWLQALKNDKNMILISSAKAEKAYNYILTGARA